MRHPASISWDFRLVSEQLCTLISLFYFFGDDFLIVIGLGWSVNQLFGFTIVKTQDGLIGQPPYHIASMDSDDKNDDDNDIHNSINDNNNVTYNDDINNYNGNDNDTDNDSDDNNDNS